RDVRAEAGGRRDHGSRPRAAVGQVARRVGLGRERRMGGLGRVLARGSPRRADDRRAAGVPQGDVGPPRVGPRGVRGHPGSSIASMPVWDVLGKRTEDDGFVVVGGVKAPDADLALLLARETHFRHKEGVAYAVRQRGSEELHVGTYESSMLGGVTDRSYRRQEAYVGVGAKLKRV